jgi:putative membrane protein
MNNDWNTWYSGWGWILWYSIFLLFFINMGNWGYTYKAHRSLKSGQADKNALEILNERYARGDINLNEYMTIKSHISRDDVIVEDIPDKPTRIRKTN